MGFRGAVAGALVVLGLLSACTTDTTESETRHEGKWARLIRHEEAAPWGTTSTASLHVEGFPPVPTRCEPPRKSEVRFSPDGKRVAVRCNAALWTIADLGPSGALQSREWERAGVNWNDIWEAPTPSGAPLKKP